MLSSPQKLSRVLRRTRLKLGVSQAEAARQAGISGAWLNQAENGVRKPSYRLATTLEGIYGVKRGTFRTRYRFARRGRPPVPAETGKALREILGAQAVQSQREAPAGRDVSPNPWGWREWRGTLENATWPMGLHLGNDAQAEVELLETRRAQEDQFWGVFNGLPFDSWTEKRFVVKLGLVGGEFVRVAPARLGARARVVDGRTGCDARHRPQVAMVVSHRGLSAAFWMQRPVQGRHTWKLDALVVVAGGGRKVTVNVELDGPQHDPARDRIRQRDVGLPTLRYPVNVVNARGFVQRLFDDLARLLARRVAD